MQETGEGEGIDPTRLVPASEPDGGADEGERDSEGTEDQHESQDGEPTEGISDVLVSSNIP